MNKLSDADLQLVKAIAEENNWTWEELVSELGGEVLALDAIMRWKGARDVKDLTTRYYRDKDGVVIDVRREGKLGHRVFNRGTKHQQVVYGQEVPTEYMKGDGINWDKYWKDIHRFSTGMGIDETGGKTKTPIPKDIKYSTGAEDVPTTGDTTSDDNFMNPIYMKRTNKHGDTADGIAGAIGDALSNVRDRIRRGIVSWRDIRNRFFDNVDKLERSYPHIDKNRLRIRMGQLPHYSEIPVGTIDEITKKMTRTRSGEPDKDPSRTKTGEEEDEEKEEDEDPTGGDRPTGGDKPPPKDCPDDDPNDKDPKKTHSQAIIDVKHKFKLILGRMRPTFKFGDDIELYSDDIPERQHKDKESNMWDNQFFIWDDMFNDRNNHLQNMERVQDEFKYLTNFNPIASNIPNMKSEQNWSADGGFQLRSPKIWT